MKDIYFIAFFDICLILLCDTFEYIYLFDD